MSNTSNPAARPGAVGRDGSDVGPVKAAALDGRRTVADIVMDSPYKHFRVRAKHAPYALNSFCPPDDTMELRVIEKFAGRLR